MRTSMRDNNWILDEVNKNNIRLLNQDNFTLTSTLDKTIIAIGYPTENRGVGKVEILFKCGDQWQKVNSIYPVCENDYDFFGRDISISGNGRKIAISMQPNNKFIKPALCIFRREKIDWHIEEIITNHLSKNSNFGYSLALNGSGDLLAIGCPKCRMDLSDIPGFYLYEKNAITGKWKYKNKYRSKLLKDDSLGSKIELNALGTEIAISTASGATTRFVRPIGKWFEVISPS